MKKDLKNKICFAPDKKNQQGITLLLALLVLSAISAIAFSLAAIVLVEIRASGDVLRTEPALYAVQGLTEQAFFKYATGALVNYPGSINNVTLTASAPIKYDDSPKVDVINTYKTYELINADNYGASGYTSFKVTFLDNGLGSTITVAATEINPTTSAQTVLNPQYISRGGYAFVAVNPAYIYEITVTNNSTSQNVTVSIETTRQGGPPHGLPFVNKKVIDVTASYTNFTRKYRVNVPLVSASTDNFWTNIVGANTSGNSITKTAVTGWGNSGASSIRSLASGDGYAEYTASSDTNNYRMGGLSNGDPDQSYTSLNYAWYMYASPPGTLLVWDHNTNPWMGTYSAGDILRVSVESGVVKFYQNGILRYSSPTPPTYPLLFDTALYSNGATITNVNTSF